MQDLLFELIQVAIRRKTCLSHTPTANEWETMYRMAESQAILGICFVGVKQTKEIQTGIPKPLFMQWLAMAAKIQQRNEEMDKKTAEVWALLNKAGLDCAVLKGQGVAELYGSTNETLGILRQSGDIDVWVKGGFDVVSDFVQKTQPTKDIAYHRFHYNMYADTEVELHHRPTLMRNLFDDRRLQRWCDSFGADSFVMTDKGFAVPSLEFNRIFILTHIYRHFLFEGIGLRQLMDYYFCLRNKELTTEDRDYNKTLLNHFGLYRFAGAVMHVLAEVYGLEGKYMICPPNKKEGEYLLKQTLIGGNFGRYDNRVKNNKDDSSIARKLFMNLRYALHYPGELLWAPIWRVYAAYWKMTNRIN